MIALIVCFIVFGVAFGIWSELSEQRRLARMANDFKTKTRTV